MDQLWLDEYGPYIWNLYEMTRSVKKDLDFLTFARFIYFNSSSKFFKNKPADVVTEYTEDVKNYCDDFP